MQEESTGDGEQLHGACWTTSVLPCFPVIGAGFTAGPHLYFVGSRQSCSGVNISGCFGFFARRSQLMFQIPPIEGPHLELPATALPLQSSTEPTLASEGLGDMHPSATTPQPRSWHCSPVPGSAAMFPHLRGHHGGLVRVAMPYMGQH